MPSQKILYLMRHGAAEKGDAYHDFNRKLKVAGIEEVQKQVEKFKAPDGIRPDCIVCSTAARAKETAGIVAGVFKGVPIFYKEALYLAPPFRLLETIGATDDIFSRILVVGHNPGLEQITGMIAKEVSFEPARCVALELNISRWREIPHAEGVIRKIF